MSPGEYNRCVDLFSDAIYRFILKNIKDKDEAKDIVQDTFEKIWVKHKEISFEKAKSYLFSTAYHTMIDRIRKNSKTDILDENYDLPHPTNSEQVDLKNLINQALEKLPEAQRSVILLRDYEGYSYEEIAEITGLSESQVKVYIYRGRLAMKNFIVALENVI